jgi:hypothetical protein
MAEHVPFMAGLVPNPLKLAHAGADIIFNGADPKARLETVMDPGKSLQDDVKFGKALVDGFVEPYKKSWAEGKYFEVAGRATFDIGSMFIGAGEANAAIKTGEVASVAAKTAEVANVAGKTAEVANVASKTGEVASVASKTAEVANVASKTGEVANVASKSGKAAEVASTAGKASEVANVTGKTEKAAEVASTTGKATEVTSDASRTARAAKSDAGAAKSSSTAKTGEEAATTGKGTTHGERAASKKAPEINPEERYMKGKKVEPIERTYENGFSFDRKAYAEAIAKKYRINLKGTNGKVKIEIDETLKPKTMGVTRFHEKGEIIRINEEVMRGGDEAQIANTIAHELSHARDFQRAHKGGAKSLGESEAMGFEKPHGNEQSLGGDGSVYGSGNALQEHIEGKR